MSRLSFAVRWKPVEVPTLVIAVMTGLFLFREVNREPAAETHDGDRRLNFLAESILYITAIQRYDECLKANGFTRSDAGTLVYNVCGIEPTEPARPD